MSTSPSPPEAAAKTPKKKSSVRHTRAIARDRSKRVPSAPPAAQVSERLTQLIHPLTLGQVAHYQSLGLRERILTLPVLVALVLSMIWRQIGSVSTLVRMLQDEGFLWTAPVQVSEQALTMRLRVLPAALFKGVLDDLLPLVQERWRTRTRPLPPELAWAQEHYSAVLGVDGSTLDVLLRKVGLLRKREDAPLAGRMTGLLDVCSRLPWALWYESDAAAHDQRCWPAILAALPAGALLLFDLGYTNFRMFAQLTVAQITFITRAKSNLAYEVGHWFTQTAQVRDALVWIGQGADRQQVRLIEVSAGNTWHRYLTNELAPARLPVLYAVALYWQRWRLEDAFNAVKRLLGLAYLWTGAENGVCVQLWATWLLYAVLVDLTDAVAERLQQPMAALSQEMLYRGLYHFTQAFQRGAASDVVDYLATHATRLGILMRKRSAAPSKFAQLQLLTAAAGP
jgi:Transposase DDE domain